MATTACAHATSLNFERNKFRRAHALTCQFEYMLQSIVSTTVAIGGSCGGARNSSALHRSSKWICQSRKAYSSSTRIPQRQNNNNNNNNNSQQQQQQQQPTTTTTTTTNKPAAPTVWQHRAPQPVATRLLDQAAATGSACLQTSCANDD